MNKIFHFWDHSFNPVKSQLKSPFYFYSIKLGICLFLGLGLGCESTSDSKADSKVKMNLDQKVTSEDQKKIKQEEKQEEITLPNSSISQNVDASKPSSLSKPVQEDLKEKLKEKGTSPQTTSSSSNSKGSTSLTQKKEPKKVPKGPCKRGIHKGRRKPCMIQRGEIKVSHINRGIKGKKFQLITEKNSITREGRKLLLELLGDWREKVQCSVGYTFNYEYMGPPSWRIYKCAVQDRLLWYLYLIGHHFDSEIQILSPIWTPIINPI